MRKRPRLFWNWSYIFTTEAFEKKNKQNLVFQKTLERINFWEAKTKRFQKAFMYETFKRKLITLHTGVYYLQYFLFLLLLLNIMSWIDYNICLKWNCAGHDCRMSSEL